MTETGFFAQKRQSPGGLALVLLLHAGVIAAVAMIKSPEFMRNLTGPIVVTQIPIEPDPLPEPQTQPQREQQRSQIPETVPIVQTQTSDQTVRTTRDPVIPILTAGLGTAVTPPFIPDPPPAPVRRAASSIRASPACSSRPIRRRSNAPSAAAGSGSA